MKLAVTRYWYRPELKGAGLLLLPFSWLFALIVKLRRSLYRLGIFKSYAFPVPVIIVGNITVGGTGKTPFVRALVDVLREQGYRPGIVSRGYGGTKTAKPHLVTENDSAREVGDEPLLLWRSGAPVVVCQDRVAAVRYLLDETDCNIVISDDGLQHYRLKRDMEIVIVDGKRRYGNRHLLPAGPLREPLSRLNEEDFVVVNGGNEGDEWRISLMPSGLLSVKNDEPKYLLSEIPNRTVHAVAGIGNPERFFETLRSENINVIPHPFPDHHQFTLNDFNFNDDLPIIMTEKDAVKCKDFATDRYWYLPVTAKLDEKLIDAILQKLKGAQNDSEEDFSRNPCCAHIKHTADRERN